MPGAVSMYSLIVPIFKNEASIPELLQVLHQINRDLADRLEVVLVVDGSPDRSAEVLMDSLPKCEFPSRLILLSRNFGSFAAIRAGGLKRRMAPTSPFSRQTFRSPRSWC